MKLRWTTLTPLAAMLLVGCVRAESPEGSVEELRAEEAHAAIHVEPARAPVAVAAAPDCGGGCEGPPADLDTLEPSCGQGPEVGTAAIRDTVPVEGSARLGGQDAPVVVVVSTDFQCPFCKRGHATLRRIVELYGERVAVVLKHNPLPMHPHAVNAGVAAEAAGLQGKFWEMADLLFAHQERLERDSVIELARTLRLNLRAFEADLDSPELAGRIRADQELAQSLGAGGTPTFWVNGRRITGAQPLSVFRAVIDEELSARD